MSYEICIFFSKQFRFQTASCYIKHFILEKFPNQFKSKLAQRYCLKQLHHQLRGKKSLEFTNRQCKKVLNRSLSYFFLFFGGTNFCPPPIVLCFPSHPFNPHYNKSNMYFPASEILQTKYLFLLIFCLLLPQIKS